LLAPTCGRIEICLAQFFEHVVIRPSVACRSYALHGTLFLTWLFLLGAALSGVG
jgi:hypothetical protein